MSNNKHNTHGMAIDLNYHESGPGDSDCACRKTDEVYECAENGCGFCRSELFNIASNILTTFYKEKIPTLGREKIIIDSLRSILIYDCFHSNSYRKINIDEGLVLDAINNSLSDLPQDTTVSYIRATVTFNISSKSTVDILHKIYHSIVPKDEIAKNLGTLSKEALIHLLTKHR